MRERGSDRQNGAPGRDSDPGPPREDNASVHGMPALPTKLNGTP